MVARSGWRQEAQEIVTNLNDFIAEHTLDVMSMQPSSRWRGITVQLTIRAAQLLGFRALQQPLYTEAIVVISMSLWQYLLAVPQLRAYDSRHL